MSQAWPPAPSWTPPAEPVGPAPGVQFAPHAERFVAYILDSLLVTVLAIVGILIVPILVGYDGSRGSAALLGAVGLIGIVFLIGYFPFFWAWSGRTPGMRLFGLRVVRDRDGGPVGIGRALLRLIGFWINGLVFYIGFAWVFVDSRRRGWHDIIAGTVVIKT